MRHKTIITKLPELPKLLNVAGYARVSTDKDAMLESLDFQTGFFKSYILAHPGWVYAGVYADAAYTGTKDDRPEFQRLLADCRAGKIDLILVKSISRLARNTVTLLQTVRELKALGVAIFFSNENLHTLSAEGELILTLLAAVAQEESRSVSENCKWRIRKQFEEGNLATLRFLYGFRLVNGKIVIEPEEAAIVKRIFAEFTSGLGATEIAKRLRMENIPTLFGGGWTPKRVRSVLQNEKYTGDAILQKTFISDHLTKKSVTNRGELPKFYSQGVLPAIISLETFEQAQQLIADNGAKYRAGQTPITVHPFTSLIHCSLCGKHFTRKLNHGRVIWHCSRYMMLGRDACSAKAIPEQTLYALTAEALGLEAFDEEKFKAKVEGITVHPDRRVVIHFKDGTESEYTWQPVSRKHSWDEAAKEQARQHAQKRRQKK